jgi:Icc-related predicted phosphoesterase
MKIAICSDIHLEFGPISLKNTKKAEVLILSGDICVAKDILDRDPHETRFDDKSSKIHKFFQECCARFKHVIYISGNHEHYHGDFAETFKIFRERLGYLINLHILDKESVLINNIMFIGGTLWTDMNKEDSITLSHMKGMMNDFRTIKNSNRMVSRKVMKYKKDENGQYVSEIKNGVNVMIEEGFKFEESISTFSPEDAVEDHKKMLGYLKVMLEGKHDQKFVVVGHHAPTKLSTHPRYADELIMNGGYSSDLSEFILDHPQIKLWTHGHTHEEFDYLIGTTRIVCNPRGYINYEDRADNFKLKFVEV